MEIKHWLKYNDLCSKRGIRSSWASAQYDQILRFCLYWGFTTKSTTKVMSRWPQGPVNLFTLFLGKLPNRLTSTECLCPCFRLWLTTALLESAVGREWLYQLFHDQISTNTMGSDPRIEPATSWTPVGRRIQQSPGPEYFVGRLIVSLGSTFFCGCSSW